MNFEAVIMDHENSAFYRGQGNSQALAVAKAYRDKLKQDASVHYNGTIPDEVVAKIDSFNADAAMLFFRTVSINDKLIEDPKTLKEEIHDCMVLMLVDKTKENIYSPVGFVRIIY